MRGSSGELRWSSEERRGEAGSEHAAGGRWWWPGGTRSGGQIMRQLPPASIDATRTVCSLLRVPLPFSSSFTEVYYVML